MWVPSNNQFDGVNSAPVNDVEVNAPFYVWDISFNAVPATVVFAPFLTIDSAGGGGQVDPDEVAVRAHNMRVMIVPPEKGR